MNTRDRVHSASQDSLCLNSLAVSRLNHNELKCIDTYYQPALNNDVGYRFVLGCQQPDCYKGSGRAGPGYNSNGFGKCVVGGIHLYHLRADEIPLPAKESSPQKLRSALKSKRSDAVSDQTFVDSH